MYCKNCGNYMDDNAQFCPNCGANQNAGSQQAPHTQAAGQPAAKVGFLGATKLFFTRYADFSGRSRRSEFWWAYLGIMILGYLVTFLGQAVEFLGWLPGVWSLAILVPSIAICVRRLHDVGKSGVFFLWTLLPLVGWIIMLIQYCKDSEGSNQWGPSPKY